MQIEQISDCDPGQHDLKPRYDFYKVGDAVKRTYVCDICERCGHQVQRPTLTVMEQIDAGIVTPEEVREAGKLMLDWIKANGQPCPLEVALIMVTSARDNAAKEAAGVEVLEPRT